MTGNEEKGGSSLDRIQKKMGGQRFSLPTSYPPPGKGMSAKQRKQRRISNVYDIILGHLATQPQGQS